MRGPAGATPSPRPRIGRPGLHRTITAISIAAIVVIAKVAAAGSHGGSTTVPTPDRFAAQVTGGSGRFAHARGTGEILYVRTGAHSVKLVFRGRRCSAGAGCVQLTGTVPATVAMHRENPDVGTEHVLSGSGRLAPLGQVSLSGAAHGTGFIAQGREMLTVRLSASGGTLEIVGRSGAVRGFTSP